MFCHRTWEDWEFGLFSRLCHWIWLWEATFKASLANDSANLRKLLGSLSSIHEMLWFLQFRASGGKANLPWTLGPHCLKRCAFCQGLLVKDTLTAFLSSAHKSQPKSQGISTVRSKHLALSHRSKRHRNQNSLSHIPDNISSLICQACWPFLVLTRDCKFWCSPANLLNTLSSLWKSR